MNVGKRGGFSLLEVLVALVVFAIGVTGMLTALGYHLRDIGYSKDHAHAVRLATREMNALRRMKYVPPSGGEGSEDRFSWRSEVEPMDLSDLPMVGTDEEGQTNTEVPCEMTVTVSWADTEGAEPTHKVRLQGIELFESE